MSVAALSPSSDVTRSGIARAQRRLADAVEEFDAAVAAGRPMSVLVARDHEVRLAQAALAAARDRTTFPASGYAVAV